MTDRGLHDARQDKVRVWDPLIRIFHWALVVAFAVAWLTADDLQPIHEIAGYAVAALVAFRLLWGLVGSRYARFTQFIRGPAAVLAYLGDMARGRERRYLRHNPAGAAMIVALLVTLSATAFTGWLMEDPTRVARQPDPPQRVATAQADEDGEHEGEGEGGEDGLEEVHEVFDNVMLFLSALQVGGVVCASVRHRENLARAMITADKHAPGPGDSA